MEKTKQKNLTQIDSVIGDMTERREAIEFIQGKWTVEWLDKKIKLASQKNMQPKTRQVLLLYTVKGKSCGDIISETGKTKQSVSNILNKFVNDVYGIGPCKLK